MPLGGVHLQRSGDLSGIRDRHCQGLPRRRPCHRSGDRRLCRARSAPGILRPHGCRECRSEGVHEDFYRTVCGAHLQGVLDTLVYLKRDTSVWFEITTLLIPGENDSDGEIDALSRWVTNTLGSDVPLHFTAFHPDWKMRDKPATPAATLSRARDIGHAIPAMSMIGRAAAPGAMGAARY